MHSNAAIKYQQFWDENMKTRTGFYMNRSSGQTNLTRGRIAVTHQSCSPGGANVYPYVIHSSCQTTSLSIYPLLQSSRPPCEIKTMDLSATRRQSRHRHYFNQALNLFTCKHAQSKCWRGTESTVNQTAQKKNLVIHRESIENNTLNSCP